jgi:hypothetical protein
MGIDGIGKPPGTPPAPDLAGVSGPRGEAFRVGETASPEAPASSETLGRLERGEIDLDGYLDERVADAVLHLADKLAPQQLDFVKQTLREQLATDPVLVELVKRAAGAAPAER